MDILQVSINSNLNTSNVTVNLIEVEAGEEIKENLNTSNVTVNLNNNLNRRWLIII